MCESKEDNFMNILHLEKKPTSKTAEKLTIGSLFNTRTASHHEKSNTLILFLLGLVMSRQYNVPTSITTVYTHASVMSSTDTVTSKTFLMVGLVAIDDCWQISDGYLRLLVMICPQ